MEPIAAQPPTPPPLQPPILDGHAARAQQGPLITYCFASLMKLNYWTPSAGFAPDLQKIMAPTSSTSLCSSPPDPTPHLPHHHLNRLSQTTPTPATPSLLLLVSSSTFLLSSWGLRRASGGTTG